jgi:hypothetical protein
MDWQALLQILERRPFVPFQIKLSSGESLDVRHPEMAALGKSQLIVIDPVTDRMAIAALLHIAAIETQSA